MSNIIPSQMYLKDGIICTESAKDSCKKKNEIQVLLEELLGQSYHPIQLKRVKELPQGVIKIKKMILFILSLPI